jgi:hypothetical protein
MQSFRNHTALGNISVADREVKRLHHYKDNEEDVAGDGGVQPGSVVRLILCSEH